MNPHTRNKGGGASWAAVAAVLAAAAAIAAWAPAASAQQDVETIYDLPEMVAAPEQQAVNAGGVHIDLNVSYLTDHVFRGIDRGEPGGGFRDAGGNPIVFDPDEEDATGAEDAPNLQFDGRLEFDLGPLPHPFVGLFVNVFNDDPVSRFQEVRPFFGLEWEVRPLTFAGGHTSYIYPEREDVDTAEVWGMVTLDDSLLFGTDKPVLSPYAFGAYDYDLYNGLYLELGVKHDFELEDTGVTLTALGRVAYVVDHPQFSGVPGRDNGFQHYDVGLVGSYSLNTLFNLSRRYGDFRLEGYLFYTDDIDDDLLAETQVWGGVGVGFRY